MKKLLALIFALSLGCAHAQQATIAGSRTTTLFSTGSNLFAVVQAATNYSGGSAVGSSQNNAATSSITGTFRNLWMNIGNAPAAGQTITTTLMVGTYGAMTATSITCQITSAGTACSDLTDTAPITAGQTYALRFVTSATSGTITGMSWGIELDSP